MNDCKVCGAPCVGKLCLKCYVDLHGDPRDDYEREEQ